MMKNPAGLLAVFLLLTAIPVHGEAEDKAFVIVKETDILEIPAEEGTVLSSAELGEEIIIHAEAGEWYQVSYVSKDGSLINGFVKKPVLAKDDPVEYKDDVVTAVKNSEVYDFPGKKEGEIIGEILKYDEVERQAVIYGTWSQITYLDDDNTEKSGYVPTNVFSGYEYVGVTPTPAPTIPPEDLTAFEEEKDSMEELEAGMIHISEGNGIFAEAEDGVAAVDESQLEITGARIGTPVAVDSNASLVPLGVFRITHYCPCSICNGPYINGVTSTGITATTNHTIAVYPQQIPYGSKVVINGQVYVAEDCGGGIKENCIDIYVATHEECDMKGVFYTEVYLLKE